MNLCIPDIGTELRLTADWTFHLCFERRNQKFGEKLGITPPDGTPHPRNPSYIQRGWWQANRAVLHTLPAGTILKVDRVYIRKGKSHYSDEPLSNFSSVTFFAYNPPTGKGKPKAIGRFWAKLADVNTIECEFVDGTP